MGYLAVMYRNEKEIDRWPNVEKRPNPRFWHRGDLLMMKGSHTGAVSWWRHEGHTWWFHKETEIPKTLRLLALLE